MNRETRRLMEREERRQKKQQASAGRQASVPGVPGTTAGRPVGEKKPIRERITGFFHDVRVEMRKVSWPTREQLIAFTTVAVVTSAALTLIVFGLDVALKELVFFVIGGTGG